MSPPHFLLTSFHQGKALPQRRREKRGGYPSRTGLRRPTYAQYLPLLPHTWFQQKPYSKFSPQVPSLILSTLRGEKHSSWSCACGLHLPSTKAAVWTRPPSLRNPRVRLTQGVPRPFFCRDIYRQAQRAGGCCIFSATCAFDLQWLSSSLVAKWKSPFYITLEKSLGPGEEHLLCGKDDLAGARLQEEG